MGQTFLSAKETIEANAIAMQTGNESHSGGPPGASRRTVSRDKRTPDLANSAALRFASKPANDEAKPGADAGSCTDEAAMTLDPTAHENEGASEPVDACLTITRRPTGLKAASSQIG